MCVHWLQHFVLQETENPTNSGLSNEAIKFYILFLIILKEQTFPELVQRFNIIKDVGFSIFALSSSLCQQVLLRDTACLSAQAPHINMLNYCQWKRTWYFVSYVLIHVCISWRKMFPGIAVSLFHLLLRTGTSVILSTIKIKLKKEEEGLGYNPASFISLNMQVSWIFSLKD